MASVAEQVAECLASGESFIVDAGAGSGKTRTLVEALTHLLATEAHELRRLNRQIACITYTNVAANEIMARINYDPLVRVSTIHEFLWSVINPFQNELRSTIMAANDMAGSKKIDGLDLSEKVIEYWQYGRKWSEGKVAHDDIIQLSADLFKVYPKLSKLLTSRFPYIFVDEYQDTHPRTIDLLLDDLLTNSPGRLTIGLFGDYMQKIYNTGVGKIERPELRVIQKTENFRCSKAVIEVLNRLRPALQQTPGPKNTAGSARLFYADGSDTVDVIQAVRKQLRSEGWMEQTEKVLMLTRKSISDDLGWRDLLAVYEARSPFGIDSLIARDDEFGELFARIELLAEAFASGRFGDYLALKNERLVLQPRNQNGVRKHADKSEAAKEALKLIELRESGSIGDVLDFLWSSRVLRKPRRVQRFEERLGSDDESERVAKDRIFYAALRELPYSRIVAVMRYLNLETPFSTHHGVKGAEFENVLVVLDDRLWNQYRFDSVLSGDTKKTQYSRSLNLLYVACSRAKNNLAVVVASSLTPEGIDGSRRIFGDRDTLAIK